MKRKVQLSVFLISAFIFSVIQGISICYAEDNSEEYYKPYINFGLAAYYANIPDVAIKYLTVAINETPIQTDIVTAESAKKFYIRGLCYREEMVRMINAGATEDELIICAANATNDMCVAAKSDKYSIWALDSLGMTWRILANHLERVPKNYDINNREIPNKAPIAREYEKRFFELEDKVKTANQSTWSYSPPFINRYLEEDSLSPKERKALMLKYCEDIRPKLYGYYDVERVEKKLKKGHE